MIQAGLNTHYNLDDSQLPSDHSQAYLSFWCADCKKESAPFRFDSREVDKSFKNEYWFNYFNRYTFTLRGPRSAESADFLDKHFYKGCHLAYGRWMTHENQGYEQILINDPRLINYSDSIMNWATGCHDSHVMFTLREPVPVKDFSPYNKRQLDMIPVSIEIKYEYFQILRRCIDVHSQHICKIGIFEIEPREIREARREEIKILHEVAHRDIKELVKNIQQKIDFINFKQKKFIHQFAIVK